MQLGRVKRCRDSALITKYHSTHDFAVTSPMLSPLSHNVRKLGNLIHVHSQRDRASVTHVQSKCACAVLPIAISKTIETRRYKSWLSGIISMNVDFGVQDRGI
jgi:hypothetical protein